MDDDIKTTSSDNNDASQADDDVIMDSNTGNNSYESRLLQEELSNQIFSGAQAGTGILGGNNEGFIDDIGEDADEVDDV